MGKLTTDLTVGDNDYATAMVLQSDGKVVVAGYAYNGDNHDYALVRYNLDGSLDSVFGDEGVVLTDLGGREDQGRSVAILSDGKILVAGATDNGTGYGFCPGAL